MGSEHYCLRWNNHQSNLLGVFSQLLQDESLVDVTLACSEGALIKAHKVVLSACSSYFQSLFLDHPEKHPIVILKDVRLAELQTLVEFMYKGEVNVQYCQLSALLKTAESLKVKGLAEMTNQNTTLREPEREPERLRPHSQPSKSTCDSPVDTTLAGVHSASTAASVSAASSSVSSTSSSASSSAANNATTNIATATTLASTAAAASASVSSMAAINQASSASGSTSTPSAPAITKSLTTKASTAHKRDASGERNSPTPPSKRQQMSPERDSSPLPLDLYQGRNAELAEGSSDMTCTNAANAEERATRSSDATSTHAQAIAGTSNKSTDASASNKASGFPDDSGSAVGGGSSGAGGTSTRPHNNGNRSVDREHEDDDDDDDDDEPIYSPPVRPASCSVLDSSGVGLTLAGVEKIEEPDSYDEEMDLDEDADDNSSTEGIGLNMKIGTAVGLSRSAVSMALPSPLGGGSGGGGGDPESARSTPATTGISIASDLTQHRATSRSPRDANIAAAGSADRPSSSGVCGLPSTSAGSMGGSGHSPSSSSAVAAALGSGCETLGSSAGLGPVQSVPLSLKKEIDCSEDDNSNSRHHMHQPRSASAGGGLGGDLDYRLSTHESLFRHFGSSFSALGNGSTGTVPARCPTPFAFPFTPFGLSLFDIDPSRILSMLHHQTWLAEEALRSGGLLASPKDFSHRFNPLNDMFAKDFHQNHAHVITADLLTGSSAGISANSASSSAAKPPQPMPAQAERSAAHQQAQQQHHYKQQQQPFNIRYPSPAAFFHHHQQQQHQQQQMKQKAARQGTPSPHTTATSTQSKADTIRLHTSTPTPTPTPNLKDADTDATLEHSTLDDAVSGHNTNPSPNLTNSSSSNAGVGANTASGCSPLLYKDSLEQLLQRRRSSSSLGGAGDTLRSYTQLLLSSGTPSCTDTSSCKEKSSSSSTSSTPPPTSALLAQHQQLSQMLKSPSESSLFSEQIEEETRCVVCNAHFPNVWLLEQHAALQHPHIGPGEEKPFICEQCGQSYRYRSAYAKHKEQNHRARLPADKLFTCDVCGMQFRYLKSFKKHRLNHALERLHGKKGSVGKHCLAAAHMLSEQDIVTSSQEPIAADEGCEDLRINVKREQDVDERERELEREIVREHESERERAQEQDSTIDSAGVMLYNNDNSSTASASTTATEPNITSSDGIHSTNKGPRLLTTPHMESDPSYHRLQRHQHQHQHPQQHQPHPQLPPHLHASVSGTAMPPHSHHGHPHIHAHHAAAGSLTSLNSLNSITSLINAERIPSEQFLGLNPQEASILNFLRVDAAERQRDKRPQTSRFACPFCGKCVRSKENLKLHVRKHTGERPFVCLFCGRAFGGKSDLTRHLRIHTGERPYHCESCGKCFARADYLSKHLTTHIHNAPR